MHRLLSKDIESALLMLAQQRYTVCVGEYPAAPSNVVRVTVERDK